MTKLGAPLVSVLMPTYNGERFLRPAIEGILNQTFANFEIIVIDDGSTDSTPQVLAEFDDPRLTIQTSQSNLGIAAATNRGLAAAKGEFIALQDHDDISMPHRLHTQVDFLRSHPDVALVASAVTVIDENGVATGYALGPSVASTSIPSTFGSFEDDLEIKWDLLFGCRLNHTSVMVRRAAVIDIGGYKEDDIFPFARDYDLFSRLALRYRLANLCEPLVQWRRHPAAACVQNTEQQSQANDTISWRNLRALTNTLDRVASATSPPPDEIYRLLGSRAFMCTPAGRLPNLPGQQVITGLHFLRDLQDKFCRAHNAPTPTATRLRKRLNWIWGKHAVALAIRARWEWNTRIRSFLLGARCLLAASWPAA
jgi:hypothetical protein